MTYEEVKKLKSSGYFNVMKGVSFGTTLANMKSEENRIHSFYDLGLFMLQKNIGSPDIFSYSVEIPGRDGLLDLTEKYYEKPTYKNRQIDIVFTCENSHRDWAYIYSRVADKLHGRLMYFCFDEDKSWYYVGRVMIDRFETNKAKATIGLSIDCEPYKTEVNPQTTFYRGEDGKYVNAWLWDPFDFRTGVINKGVEHDISNEIEITIYNMHKRVQPYFRVTQDVVITHDKKEYTLKQTIVDGDYKWTRVDGIWVDEGKNTLKVKPVNGKVDWFAYCVIGGIL